MINIKCTIFNTKETTNALGQIVTQFGILRQSSSDLVKNFKNADGVFSKVGSIFKTNDANAFASFIKQVDGGTRKLEAYKNTMTGCSKETRQLAAQVVMGTSSTQQASSAIKAMTGSTIGLTVATTALNMALTMGISMALTGLISLISNAVHHFENVKEKANGYIESLRSSNKEMSDNAKTISELNDEYKVLSKGVNSLGENVNLTSDEYKRYKEITNQVADIMPELVKGFNSQGDAILDTTAKLKDLNELYKITQRNKANEEYIKSKDNGDIDSLDELWATYYTYNDDINAGGISNFKEKNKNQYKTYLEELSTMGYKSIKSIVDTISTGYDAKTDEEKKNLVFRSILNDLGFNSKSTEEDYETIISNITSRITSLDTELRAINSQIGESALQYAKSYSDNYWNLDSDLQTFVNSFFSNLDEYTIENNELNDVNGREKFVTKFINDINKNSDKVQGAYKKLLTLDEKSLSISEKQQAINNIIQTLSSYLDLPQNHLKIILGLDTDTNLYTQFDKVRQQAASRFGTKYTGNTPGETYYTSSSEQTKWEDENIRTQEDVDLYQKLLRETKDENITFLELTQKFTEAKAEVIKANSQTLSELWNSINESDTKDPLAATKKSIIDLAKAGKLTSDTFNEISGSTSFLEKLGIKDDDAAKIDKLVQSLNDMHDSADQLSSMSKGISSLSSNLATVKENEKAKKQSDRKAITSDTFAGMDSGLKEQTEEWENYKKVLGDVNSTYAECKQATNDLATAYVNSANFLANLTKENKGYYISQLDAMGVENAEEIVKQALIDKTQELELKTRLLNSITATSGEVIGYETNMFLNEANASDTVRLSLVDLIAQEKIFNSTSLSVEDKINALHELALAALGASAALSFKSSVKVGNDGTGKGGAQNANETVDAATAWKNMLEQQKKTIEETRIKTKPTSSSSSTGTGSKGKKGSSSKSNKESQKKEIDWIEVRLDRLSDKYDKLSSKAEDVFAIPKERTKAYEKTLDNLNKQIHTTILGEVRYQKQLNKYGKKLPKNIKDKIKNGTIDIENYKGDKLVKNIEGYQKYYEKIVDLQKKRNDLRDKERQLWYDSKSFEAENLKKDYDLIQAQIDSIENTYSMQNNKGTQSQYNSITQSIGEQIDLLLQQRQIFQEQLDNVDEFSDKWYDAKNNIINVDKEIAGLKNTIIENAVKPVEQLNESFEKTNDEIERRRNLLSTRKSNYTNLDDKLANNRAQEETYYEEITNYNDAVFANKDIMLSNANTVKSLNKGKLKKANGTLLSTIYNLMASGQEVGSDLIDQIVTTDKNGNKISGVEQLFASIGSYNTGLTNYNTNTDKLIQAETELPQNISELAQQNFSDIKDEYQEELDEINVEKDKVDSRIEVNRSKGLNETKEDYQERIKLADEEIKKKEELVKALEIQNEADYRSGRINEDIYKKQKNEIADTYKEIESCKASQNEWNKAIRNIPIERIEKILDLIDKLNGRYDKLITLAKQNSKTDLANERTVAQLKNTYSHMKNLAEEENEIRNDLAKAFKNATGTDMNEQIASEIDYLRKNDPDRLKEYFKQYGIDDYNNIKDIHDNITKLNDVDNSRLEDAIASNEKVVQLGNSYLEIEEKKIAKLKKEKDIQDRTLALEKTRFNLEKAKNNLTTKTWDAVTGQWVYTADEEAISSAQEAYDNTYYDNMLGTAEDILEYLKELAETWTIYDENGNLKPGVDFDTMLSGIISTLANNGLTAIDEAISSTIASWFSDNPNFKEYIQPSGVTNALNRTDGVIGNNIQTNSNSNENTTTIHIDKVLLPETHNLDELINNITMVAKQYNWERK